MPEDQLFLREAGPAAAPAIVFLHGGPLSSLMWQPQLDRLADFYCLAPDLPGHGQSEAIQPFALEDAARRVAEIIRQKAAGQTAHVVGLSLGGAVALTLLRIDPRVVDRAVVSGTAAGLDKITGYLGLALAGTMRLMSAKRMADSAVRQFGVPPEYRPLFYDDYLRGNTAPYLRHVVRALMGMKLPEQIERPLLVAVGGKETLAAKGAARKLTDVFPGARGVAAPGLGHLWNLQAPDLFSAAVRAWVTDQPLPPELRPL
jgi:pimeloyl-ACP methyl ester carboxylesterase